MADYSRDRKAIISSTANPTCWISLLLLLRITFQNVLSEENFTRREILECSLNCSVYHGCNSRRNYIIIARKLCTFINIQINSVHVYITFYKTHQEFLIREITNENVYELNVKRLYCS